MTKVKHTPGPWRVGYSDDSGTGEDGFYCVTASDTECVVRSGESFGLGYGIENAADARLIAAAPDMLAALIDIQSAGRDELNDSASEAWQVVAAAISKATGEA